MYVIRRFVFWWFLPFQNRLRVRFCLVFMSSLRPQIRRFVDPSVFQKSFHQLSRTLLTHLNRPSVEISIRIQTWNSYSSGILRCVQRIELVGWMRIDGRSVGIGNLVAGRTNIGTRSRGLCRPANRSHRRIQGRWGRPSLEKSGMRRIAHKRTIMNPTL